MDGKEVAVRLARAWTVADWYEFLGLVRPVELAIRESPDEEKAISPVLIDLAFERGNAEGQLAGELFAACRHPESMIAAATRLRERKAPPDAALEQLAVSLVTTLTTQVPAAMGDDDPFDHAIGLTIRALEGWDGTVGLNLQGAFGRGKGPPRPTPVQIFDLPPGRAPPWPQVQAGDCLFRDLAVGVIPALRDLGHTAIFAGWDGQGDPGLWSSYVIVEMSPSGCHTATVADFINTTGTRFWGIYGVDISPGDRRQLVKKALQYVGVAAYATNLNYKNPSGPTFRCDGLVEHCYESLSNKPAPLDYRNGLFEDDKWYTISPAALRNCMSYKLGP